VEGANKNDFKILRDTLKSIPIKRPPLTVQRPQGLSLDKGYDYEEVRVLLKRFHFAPHIRSRGEEARSIRKDPRIKARRWVVERTHSWMNRFRAILIGWTKKPESFTAQLHLWHVPILGWGNVAYWEGSKGDFVIAPSAACHFHSIPCTSAYSSRPPFHSFLKTPALVQR
jgi:putative transposase